MTMSQVTENQMEIDIEIAIYSGTLKSINLRSVQRSRVKL